MSVRMRHTRGHTGNRRSHHALTQTASVTDKESGKLRLPHRIDESTGKYRGKLIKEPKAKKVSAKHEHKVKGADTEPKAEHTHEHAHAEHENAEVKGTRGIVNKFVGAGRPKARSGMGGGA